MYSEAFHTTRSILNSVREGEPINPTIVKDTVENIIQTLINTDSVFMQLTGIRDIDNYTFLHSLDVLVDGASLVMNPVFDKLTFSYVVTVGKETQSVILKPISEDVTAKVYVNNVSVKYGESTNAITLPTNSDTVIPITVVADDGTTTKTYSVTVKHIVEEVVEDSIALDVPKHWAESVIVVIEQETIIVDSNIDNIRVVRY